MNKNYYKKTSIIETKKPELLAPAGNIQSFLAALAFGADAIYLGAGKFSARAFAGNFSKEELIHAIDYAHSFGVSVNVTINTLYRDSEFESLFETVKFLYEAGADALIIQDLGLLYLLSETFPEIPFHASTQMTVHNSKHLELLKEKGIKRVIPARELNVSELKALKENTGVEVETFIHGALCFCYSGQCLFSSFIGGRSGNRGQCAQPCRKKYNLVQITDLLNPYDSVDLEFVTDGKYLISPKDLNSTNSIQKLIEIGIDSFKIEGRMKRYEYVGGVVKTYRKIIDSYFENYKNNNKNSNLQTVSKENKETLQKLFNRGFTDGYFLGNPGNDLMSRRLPYNRGLAAGTVQKVDDKRREISVLLSSDLCSGDGISIGNVKSETTGFQDPRSGFTVRKMFSNNRICDIAHAGEIVSIPSPSLFEGEKKPEVGDILYITSDDKLHREIEDKMPKQDLDEIKELINSLNSEEFSQSIGVHPFKIPVSFKLIAKKGYFLTLILKREKADKTFTNEKYEDGIEKFEIVQKSDYIVEESLKNPFKEEQAQQILSGLGTTFFEPKTIEIETDPDIFIPLGVLKGLRNDALSSLLREIAESYKRKSKYLAFEIPNTLADDNNFEKTIKNNETMETIENNENNEFSLAISVYSKNSLISAISAGADRVYVGGNIFKAFSKENEMGLSFEEVCTLLEKNETVISEKSRIFYRFPQIVKDDQFETLKDQVSKLMELGIGGFVASNPGVLKLLSEIVSDDFYIISDLSFNVFNSHAAKFVYESGADCVTLSSELSLKDLKDYTDSCIENYGKKIPSECLIHGLTQVMITEHPLIQSLAENNESIKEKGYIENTGKFFALEDSKGFVFPVLIDESNRNHIFNSKVLNTIDFAEDIFKAGITNFKIEGIGMSSEDVSYILKLYRDSISGKNIDLEEIDEIFKNSTKGMYMRHVL